MNWLSSLITTTPSKECILLWNFQAVLWLVIAYSLGCSRDVLDDSPLVEETPCLIVTWAVADVAAVLLLCNPRLRLFGAADNYATRLQPVLVMHTCLGPVFLTDASSLPLIGIQYVIFIRVPI